MERAKCLANSQRSVAWTCVLVVLLVDVASAQSFTADKTSPVVSCRRARDVHIAARCCPEHSCSRSKLPASPNGDQVDRSQQARGELGPPVDVAMALSSMSLPTGPVSQSHEMHFCFPCRQAPWSDTIGRTSYLNIQFTVEMNWCP